jgi:hypothetical protein
VVAGKTAYIQARLLDRFLAGLAEGDTPFAKLRQAIAQDTFEGQLRASRLGQYNRLSRAIRGSLSLDLRHCTVAELEAIHGVGPKTARFFLTYARPHSRYAIIDTHTLKLLREAGYTVPRATPSGRKYLDLEQTVLALADAAGMTPADYDLSNWLRWSRRDPGDSK